MRINYIAPACQSRVHEVLGVQVIRRLRMKGVHAVVRNATQSAWRRVRKEVFYVIGACPAQTVYELKERKNIIIVNLGNSIAEDKFQELSFRDCFDGVIHPTVQALEDHQRYFSSMCVHRMFPYYCDERVLPNRCHEFTVGAVDGSDLRLCDDLGINGVRNPESRKPYRDNLRRFSCHFAVTAPGGLEERYGSATAVFDAMKSRANIVLTGTTVNKSLLEGYPFETRNDPASVLETLEEMRAAYGTKLWMRGLRELDGLEAKYSNVQYSEMIIEMVKELL